MLDAPSNASDWTVAKLESLFKLSSGNAKPDDLAELPDETKRFPVYGGNGIMGYSSLFNAEGNNIVIGRVGANCGCVRHVEGRCWITDNALYTTRKNSEYDSEYVAYLLEFLDLSKLRGQSGQPLITQGPIHSLKVSIAPLAEQHKIARTLNTWDDAIKKLEVLCTAKERRLDALRSGLLFGSTRLGRLRRNWEFKRLSEVTIELTERNGSMTLSRDAVMGVTNSRGIVPMREHTVAKDISRYKRLPPRAFAYNPMRINVGSIAINEGEETVLVSPDYVVFACKSDGMDPGYLNHLRRTRWWTHHITSGGSGSVRQRTYYDDLAALHLPLPEVDEQQQIVRVLDSAAADVHTTEKIIAALTRQKKGLMQKLLSGKWRVKPGPRDG